MAVKRSVSSFTMIVVFVCLSLVGMVLIPLLPVKLSPSRTLPGLTITYSMAGNSSRIVEAEVTGKLEGMLSRVKGIKKITSVSDNGSGNIQIELDKHADIDAARFEISTIIRQIWQQFPDGVSYPKINQQQSDDDAGRPFMSYTLNSPSNPIEIQSYAERKIKPLLSRIKGIYKVEISGATPMEWQLEYSSDQLSQLDISLDDIQSAIKTSLDKEFMGIGYLESSQGKQWMRVMVAPDATINSFNPSDIHIRTKNGNKTDLNKLIKVKYVEEVPQSYYRINGLNSVYLNITADETANQLHLNEEVKTVIKELQYKMPAGYEIHTAYDATEYIRDELNKIYFRTALTILILLLFVAVITKSLRYVALVVASLTANLSIAVIFYYLFDLEMQLYSMAGITISLSLILDNIIVMTDHLLHRKNMKAFLSILAATLTTIGALGIIFFMSDKIRLNLQDFAAVVIINLAVSLFVALFFVPSFIEKTGMKKNRIHFCSWSKRTVIYITRCYKFVIRQMCRCKPIAYIILILTFGLPVFMLPEKMEGEGRLARYYNKVFDTPTYKETVKPITDKLLGGTLRLFVEDVYNGSYFDREDEVVLSVYATLPNGNTLEQMNHLVRKMETFLSSFKEIKQFQTSVYSARQAQIQILFSKKIQRSGFPYTLKANIISKALELGGGSWSVFGLQDQGFSNDIRENAGSFRVKMYGYNYDELNELGEKLKEKLLEHRRIKEVTLNSEFSWWKDDYREYYLSLDKGKMVQSGITSVQLFDALSPAFGKNISCGSIISDDRTEILKLSSREGKERDVWALLNIPFTIDGKECKLSDIAEITKEQAPQKIARENQQYRLCLQYEYIGSTEQGKKILERDLKEFNASLPMGYTAQNDEEAWGWDRKDKSQYFLLLLVVIIIFFISSILFDSLKQPLAIIFVIPISYIGVFLTFYLFKLNFDQGGFAALVLLCGITVNASIYVLNEYNSIRNRYRNLSPTGAFTKAWNSKAVPIFLTVISTIFGFIPFMVGEVKEAFWFPLAAGTIGGLIMSVVGIYLFLPLFVVKKS